ncbi:hypothetical protein LEP1GSC192_1183 [Leptospira sp. B5-022]|nr:hypothetical protein LEP1GSC192_1183 [Leptospira sp. B5-022]
MLSSEREKQKVANGAIGFSVIPVACELPNQSLWTNLS